MNQVVVRLLKDGRVKYHWFIHDKDGPIHTPARVEQTALGILRFGGVTGRIACQKDRKDVAPKLENGDYHLCMHTDDVRAATCPDCLATPEAAEARKILGEILETAHEAVPQK